MKPLIVSITTHNQQTFRACHFKSSGKINALCYYKLTIQADPEKTHSLFNYINTQATLSINVNNNTTHITGMIRLISGPKTYLGHWHYTIILTSPTYLLTLNKKTRYFNNSTLTSIINTVFSNYPTLKHQCVFSQHQSNKILVVQKSQSDFNFILHLCQQYTLYFMYSIKKNTLIICDDLNMLTHANSSSLTPINYTATNQPQTKNDYFTSPKKIIHHAPLTKKNDFSLTAYHRSWLSPGCQILLNHCPQNSDNGCYIIQSMQSHTESTHNSAKAAVFISTIHAIKLSDLNNPTSKPTKQPNSLALALATIDNIPNTSYSAINKHGQYHVLFSNDSLTHKPLQGSPALSLNQPLTGNHYGQHFPLLQNTPMIVQHIPELPEQAYLLGTIYHQSFTSPINQNHADQHIMSTPYGNKIILNDDPDNSHIQITTAKHNRIQLQSTPTAQITMQSNANLKYLAKHAVSYHGTHRITWHSQRNDLTIIGNHATIQSQQNTTWRSQQNIHCLANKIKYQSNYLHMHSKQSCTIHATHTIHYQCHTFSGTLNQSCKIQGTHTINIQSKTGNIYIQCGNAGLTLSANGHIELKGTLINLYGLNTQLTGL